MFSGHSSTDMTKVYAISFDDCYRQNNGDFSQVLTAAIHQGQTLAMSEIQNGQPYLIEINFYKADYRLASPIELINISNLKINGNGSKLIYTDKCRAILMDHCENLTWTNLTIDYDPLLFTQGVITAIKGHDIDVKIDKGYRTDIDTFIRCGNNINIMDPSVGGIKAGTRDYFYAKSYHENEDGTYRLQTDIDINTTVTEEGQYYVKPGDRFVLAMRDCNAVEAAFCEHIVYENITLHNGGMGFVESFGEGGNIYRNVKITPGPKPDGTEQERLYSTCADALHSAGVKKGPLVEKCLFEKMGDDGINVHGFYGFGAKQIDEKTWLVSPRYVNIMESGDNIEIIDAHTYETKIVTKAVRVEKMMDPSLMSLAEQAWAGKLPPHDLSVFLRVEFEDKVQMTIGDGVCSMSRIGVGAVVRDSVFQHLRSRGIIVKSSDAVIENNIVYDTGLSGIMCSPEIGYWGEAHFARHIVIRNNKVSRCNTSVNCKTDFMEEEGAITVSIFAPLSYKGLYQVRQNQSISIERNTITDSRAYAMALTNIDGLNVIENQMTDTWVGGIGSGGGKFGLSEVTGHIFIGNSSNVVVSGNTYGNNQYIKEKVQVSGVTNYQIS